MADKTTADVVVDAISDEADRDEIRDWVCDVLFARHSLMSHRVYGFATGAKLADVLAGAEMTALSDGTHPKSIHAERMQGILEGIVYAVVERSVARLGLDDVQEDAIIDAMFEKRFTKPTTEG